MTFSGGFWGVSEIVGRAGRAGGAAVEMRKEERERYLIWVGRI